MPEIWLNYGLTDVVLDIRAENLDRSIDSEGEIISDEKIAEKLTLDLTKPIELVVLHNSRPVQKIISIIHNICEQKSITPPKILAEKQILRMVKATLPENSTIDEFDSEINSDLVFLGEIELDGLFGYETIATRLLRKFGQEDMLSAYTKRAGNRPTPGKLGASIDVARKFVDKFEIQGIELVTNSKGIVDFDIAHPSKTIMMSQCLEKFATQDVGKHKSMIISTGKAASNNTLAKALNSLWSCSAAINENGLAILLAESKFGLGSDTFQQFIENRLTLDTLKNPTKYIQGMEDLLFLTEIQNSFQIGLVSTLPEFYTKQLNMVTLNGVKLAMDYILKTQGTRQKISIIHDGARTLLR